MKKVILVVVAALGVLALGGCSQSMERSVKDFQSEYGGGLHRTVEVYSDSGKLLKTYTGNIDIRENDYGNEVLFDLNGKRVLINNAIVVTEEK